MRHIALVLGSVLLGLVLAVAGGGCALPGATPLPDPTVYYIAFGDSTTAGPADRTYPTILNERINNPERIVANEGRSGETVAEGLARLQQILADRTYPGARVLMYWEGGKDITEFMETNDPLLLRSPDDPDYPFDDELNVTLDAIQANVEEALQEAWGAGLDLWVTTYYPLAPGVAQCDPLLLDILLPSQAANGNVYIDRLNARLRQAAINQGADIVDVAALGDQLQADPANYFNCNHLSDEGNAIVADLFFTTLMP